MRPGAIALNHPQVEFLLDLFGLKRVVLDQGYLASPGGTLFGHLITDSAAADNNDPHDPTPFCYIYSPSEPGILL